MKKKILVLILSTMIIASVTIGCGNSSKTDIKTSAEQSEKNKNNQINLKDLNKIDDVIEYKFIEIQTDKKIQPPVPGGFSTYYEAKKDGEKYIDFLLDIKNLKNEKINIENILKCNIKIDGKEYNTFSVIESEDGTKFDFANITDIKPLTSSKVHLLSEVPETELDKEIELIMKVEKKDYSTKFKLQDVVREKKMIKVGETINSEKHSEIKINSLEFKNKLEPTKPKDFYTYYELKDPNKTYLVLCVDAKNLKSEKLKADAVMGVKLTCENKYKYDSFATIEEVGGGNLSYANITSIDPLTTSKMYYLCEIPQEIKDKPMELQLNINGNKYYIAK